MRDQRRHAYPVLAGDKEPSFAGFLRRMNHSNLASLLVLGSLAGAALTIGPTERRGLDMHEADSSPRHGGDDAHPVSDPIEAATARWWVDFEESLSTCAESGVQREGVVYRWTGPTPIEIPMIVLGLQGGKPVLAPEPVAYALQRGSPSWVEDYCPVAGLALPGPSTCNAKLVKGPPPSLGMRFVCEQQCGSGISCLASQSSPQQMGYCSCGQGNPPSYCYGNFTTTDSGLSWTVQCFGPCEVPKGCSIKTVNDGGFELYWCECQ